jgi:nucleoside-diphosphate-sugar epimerase
VSIKASILVVGGGSSVAVAVAEQLGERAVVAARRPRAGTDDILVGDYAMLPPSAFEGIERVVNCVGISAGPPDLLERVNVVIPGRIAAAAREAGVQQIIHVSSFSVYGGAPTIDRTTPTGPTGDYGRTKLAADRTLLALAGRGFDVAILRLPLIYTRASLGKLGRLLRLWRRARILPVPAGDIRRAMIATELAAEVIARLASIPPVTGIMFAADPEPFTYRGAARAQRDALSTSIASRCDGGGPACRAFASRPPVC